MVLYYKRRKKLEYKDLQRGFLGLVGARAGLYQFDPDGIEAKALEERLGLKVIRHGKFLSSALLESLSCVITCYSSALQHERVVLFSCIGQMSCQHSQPAATRIRFNAK